MYQLINQSENILIAGIPDIATARYEFNEIVAFFGDLDGDTFIYDTATGEIVEFLS